jgi:hypothetical protein
MQDIKLEFKLIKLKTYYTPCKASTDMEASVLIMYHPFEISTNKQDLSPQKCKYKNSTTQKTDQPVEIARTFHVRLALKSDQIP